MLITNFVHFGIHMLYNEPVYGARSPRRLHAPHNRAFCPQVGGKRPSWNNTFN